MLKEAIEKLLKECGDSCDCECNDDLPLVWKGVRHSPYDDHRDELDSHRDDGMTSFDDYSFDDYEEDEEDWDDDEPMNDFDYFERNRERGDEVEDFMRGLYDEEDQEEEDDLYDYDWEEDFDEEDNGDAEYGDLDDDEEWDQDDENQTDNLDDDEDLGLEDEDDMEGEDDPDRQGLIRVVPGAHLVYKRVEEDGTYEELWIFNTGDQDFKKEMQVRRGILAGTDIPPNKMKSDDGSQSYTLWSAGNAQMLHITGLPS
jgi:hypothetical protein